MRYFAFCVAAAICGFAQDFSDGQAARLLMGQPNFTAQTPGPASAVILGGAGGIAYANNMLFVADANRVGAAPVNNRVLIFNDLSSFLPGPNAEIPQINARCPACLGEATVVVGQPDFTKTDLGLTASGLRTPTAVATDGNILVVADTDNNRILLWRAIPNQNNVPADVVLGQNNFTTVRALAVDNKSFRGPQGVWIQNGRLFVADTMNHRVLIWNSIPTSNDAPADLVVGQPNFNTAPQPDLTQAQPTAQNNTLLNPVSVTSDGIRMFVADLGHQRVLIWNRIPTQNQEPADVVVGQPNFTTARSNNSAALCESNGTDENGNTTYPTRCAATLDFPRFVLSDGRQLFVADGGNDRVLIWNRIPLLNGRPADAVLGQLSPVVNNTSDSASPDKVAAADTLRTPLSLAWDGTNLFVGDPFNRRILLFTPAESKVPYTGVRNSASLDVFAVGGVTFSGELKENDEVTLKIVDKEYKYKLVANDSFNNIVDKFVEMINAGSGDPNVLATLNRSARTLLLTARTAGEPGNAIEYSTTLSEAAVLTATTAGPALAGGQNAARLAGGTLVTILGERLAEGTAEAPAGAETLPRELAGVRVYIDGIASPISFVSPSQINAQLPWEVADATSANAVVRTARTDGSVSVSAAIAVPLIAQNPGIYAGSGPDPRPGIALHGSSFATGTISVDGGSTRGNTATVVIADREYTYTVEESTVVNEAEGTSDNEAKLAKIRDGLIAKINEGSGDPDVIASAAGVFTRIRLQGRRPGPDLDGIPISTKIGTDATVILTATNSALCCANVEGAIIDAANPAIPGETIVIYATGLGAVKPAEAQAEARTGEVYRGPSQNEPVEFVSSLAGGKTANVIAARLKPGTIGLYEVVLELNSDLPTDAATQLTIAQSFQVSNIVTLHLKNPRDQ